MFLNHHHLSSYSGGGVVITSTRSRNQPSNSNKELTTPAFDSTSLSRAYLLHRHAVKHCYGIVRVDAGTLLFSQTQVEVSFKLFCFVLVNSHSVFNRESMCSQTLCSISTPLFLLSPPEHASELLRCISEKIALSTAFNGGDSRSAASFPSRTTCS